MSKTLNTKIELARWLDKAGTEKRLTIQGYLDLVSVQDEVRLADFIFQRLYSRYLKPFSFKDRKFEKEFKNGFSIMANCCLLIETLQSFKNGWDDSDGKSTRAFREFFASETNFAVFAGKEKEFYKHVRCGILHQGETTGGWTINRKGRQLFDEKTLVVDSVRFARELEKSLAKYSSDLKASQWNSGLWDNFRTKMKKIISNCEK